MVHYIARKIAFLILSLFLLSIAVFALCEIAPGNIATNTLGILITPAQEASFNAQFGLDDPAVTRYIRWTVGSDWQASRLIGHPLTRITDEDGRISWWVVDDNGTFYKNDVDSEGQIMRLERQIDGGRKVTQNESDLWEIDREGVIYFWGITVEDKAAMWIHDDTPVEQLSRWKTSTSETNAPRDYLPLQRGLLRGDPGVSFKSNQPISVVLFSRFSNSLLLAGISFILIMPISLLLGVVAGLNDGGTIDRFLSFIGIVASVTPQFVSGILLIQVFAVWLKWLPGATVLDRGNTLLNQPKLLVLPILTLMMLELGYMLRITRISITEVMNQDYIRTAVLKGLPSRRIIWRHAFPNALLVPLTVMMLHVNWLIGGLFVVEVIFGFPGLGSYLLEAAMTKDVFALEAGTMLLLLIAVTTQLIADVSYTFLNPRIRYT